MPSEADHAPKRWYSKGRWAYALAIIGGAIVTFVALTGGTVAVWILWIGVPLLMIGLFYTFLANMLYYLRDSGLLD